MGPPNGRVPRAAAPRDPDSLTLDQEDRHSDGTATGRLPVRHVSGIDGWPALAAWLGATT